MARQAYAPTSLVRIVVQKENARLFGARWLPPWRGRAEPFLRHDLSYPIAQIGKRDHERHRFYRGRMKAKTEVKCLGLFRNSVHQNPSDPDDVGRIDNTSRAITHERPTEAAALM